MLNYLTKAFSLYFSSNAIYKESSKGLRVKCTIELMYSMHACPRSLHGIIERVKSVKNFPFP